MMINVYKLLLNIFKLIINLLFVIQIALIILIFLTATYWFFDLIGSSLFSFAAPIAGYISDFIKLFYTRDIIVGGIYVDGSLLLFDILALILIFVISKSKFYFYRAEDFFNKQIYKCKKNIEDNFNVKLKKDADEMIKKYTNVAFLITFVAKDLKVDRFWGGDANAGIKETEDYIMHEFCSILDNMSYVTYKKGSKKIMIYLKDFEKVDGVLNAIDKFVKTNKNEMRKNRWTLDYYCSVATYENSTSVELDVLPQLESLLKIKQKNEIICFGSFNLRYLLKERPLFYGLRLKGSYAIDGGSDIFCLVKKD